MRTAGHIFIDRKKSESAIRVLEKTKKSLLDNPRSILLFPEGTRTQDGSIGPFKKGGLLLSLDTKLPIVPIAFIGSFEMLGKGSYSMKGRSVELGVGTPIETSTFSFETRKELADHVREKVSDLV